MNGKTPKSETNGRQQITRIRDWVPGSWVIIGPAHPTLAGSIQQVRTQTFVMTLDRPNRWLIVTMDGRTIAAEDVARLATDDEIRRAPWVRRAA